MKIKPMSPSGIFWILSLLLLAGCASGLPSLSLDKPRNVPPEYRQKVGLFVHEEAERFYYPGTTTLDISDLMAFHLQQVLPFSAQGSLKELFTEVEMRTPGPRLEFKSTDLAGYFEIKVTSVRYDYPDPDVANYRGEVELYVEFKTMQNDVVWKGIFKGDGISFSNADRNLTRFGREAGSALEDAFQDAVDRMQDGVLSSQQLRTYLRDRLP